VVPQDALEKILWAEADKMGFFINTVTESVVAKEKQVVKNEKRQSYDNRPYGHTNYVIDKNLYPEGPKPRSRRTTSAGRGMGTASAAG
jgi:zinc protease